MAPDGRHVSEQVLSAPPHFDSVVNARGEWQEEQKTEEEDAQMSPEHNKQNTAQPQMKEENEDMCPRMI